jgi:hypothetical protein
MNRTWLNSTSELYLDFLQSQIGDCFKVSEGYLLEHIQVERQASNLHFTTAIITVTQLHLQICSPNNILGNTNHFTFQTANSFQSLNIHHNQHHFNNQLRSLHPTIKMSGQPPSSPAQAGATRAPTPLECNFLVAIVKNSDGVTNVSNISSVIRFVFAFFHCHYSGPFYGKLS